MDIVPGGAWTQLHGDQAAQGAMDEAASGGCAACGSPLATVAPALFELLTRLLLTDRSIRDSWH